MKNTAESLGPAKTSKGIASFIADGREFVKSALAKRAQKTADAEGKYERNERLWNEYGSVFGEYIREYLLLHEMDYGNMESSFPKDDSPLMQDLARQLAQITGNTLSAQDLLRQFSPRISTLFSDVVLANSNRNHKPAPYVAVRNNIQTVLNDASFGIRDQDRPDFSTLRQQRALAYQTQKELYAENHIRHHGYGDSLSMRDRIEERDAALIYLDQHAPALAERLRPLLKMSTWNLLVQVQALFEKDDAGLEVVKQEFERQKDPLVKEALESFLEHTFVQKVTGLYGSGWLTYLFNDYQLTDISAIEAKKADKNAVHSEALDLKAKDQLAYQALQQAYNILNELCSIDRTHKNQVDTLKSLDHTEVHRLTMHRSIQALQHDIEEIIGRLDYAESNPGLAIEVAAGLRVPTVRAVIKEDGLNGVNMGEKASAALAETYRRIKAKKTAYQAVLDATKQLPFIGETARIELPKVLEDRVAFTLEKKHKLAEISVESREQKIVQELAQQIETIKERFATTDEITELVSHTPTEVVKLADKLQKIAGQEKSKDRWANMILASIYRVINGANNSRRVIENGLDKNSDSNALKRATNHPALPWVDKITENGSVIQ